MTVDPPVRGAAPGGAEPGNEADSARVVREMFGRIAPRYDLLNHLLSGQLDRYWRRCLVRAVRPWLSRQNARIADFCCGTGDVALALSRERERLQRTGAPALLGSDFSRPMLQRAAQKMLKADSQFPLVEADALRMPLSDGCLDLIAVAYGFRNLANYGAGAEEFARLLAPGGCLAILEFSQPTSRLWRAVFNVYFKHVLPHVGEAVSRSGGAYSYLQRSVARFPDPEEIRRLLASVGFQRVESHSLTGGVSVLYLAYR